MKENIIKTKEGAIAFVNRLNPQETSEARSYFKYYWSKEYKNEFKVSKPKKKR